MTQPSAAFIPSPPSNGLHLGPFFLHAYGLAYVVAVVAAVAITAHRWEKVGGRRELAYEVALWGFPAGILGGRLYFVATSWNEVPPHWWGPLAVWKGGLGIWGGVAAGTLAGVWVLRRRGASIPTFLDAAAPALLVAQAIGRVGNYFNQELFGGPTSLPWGLEISAAHRPAGYAQYATFHPTFLYEIVWNLLLAAALVWLGHHRRIRPPGLFALYVAGYSFGRVGEELLRVDPAHHIFGLRLNLYVASILCLAGLIWFVRIQRAGAARPTRRSIRRGGALFAAGGLLALAGCGQASHQASAAQAAANSSETGSAPDRTSGFARSARRFSLTASESRSVDQVLRYTSYVRLAGHRRREVALTFDDGPGEYTPGIIRILRRTHTPATFFVIGRSVRRFPRLVAEEARDAFQIGDHTETHPFLSLLPRAAQTAQIADAAHEIERAGAPTPRLFRPPYGAFDRDTLMLLRARRMLMALWSVDTNDYARPGVKRIVYAAVSGAQAGAIILMHDGGGNRSQTVAALPHIIRRLHERGFRMVTISKLVSEDPPPRGQAAPRPLSGRG